jgi:subtilisin family serine protease
MILFRFCGQLGMVFSITNYKSEPMRYFQSLLVVAIILLSSSVFAQSELSPPEPQIVSESVGPEAKPAPVMSEPDYRVLRRIKSFRGPYSDQDDPQLQKRLAKEAERKGVDVATTACRPPSCAREANTLIIKVATPGQEQKVRAKAGASAQYSDLFDEQRMMPIFSPKLVANVIKTYANIMGLQQGSSANLMPKNSLGNRVDLDRWRTLSVPKGVDLDAAIEELSLDPRVEVVEPNYEMRLLGEESKPTSGSPVQTSNIVADDPRKSDQWALTRTRTEDAWQWLEDNGYPAWGDRNIVVAVIDSGVDYTHEDLAGNMWVNAGEIPDNGIDDDNNGFVDDVYGADVVGSTYDHDGDPQDDNGHGTHVAGIIAAQGNNGLGIIGVAPNTQIMAIKAAQYSGALTSTDISEGILYAYQQGADIINMSFGGSGRTVLTEEALAVAFSNAVLIAAAGNDGKPNQICGDLPYKVSYPAAYPYVLGVMAEAEFVNSTTGDWLTGFSNWDCTAKNGLEYEVMAPGGDILSTIPGNGYAEWDGTSMAAPVVAGMAALVRTRFDDKSIYSSRFIMGQLASTGSIKQGITPPPPLTVKSYFSADALSALINVPNPSLSYLEHYLWDDTNQGATNDADGIVDAGETIELGVIIKNYWGMADDVTVNLAAQGQGAVGVDPYVTWDVDTVNYGGVGSFNQDDNGLTYDSEGLLLGVSNPFRFTIASNTPNEHIIPILVTMTASNGLDPTDTELYTTESRFNLIVQRGRELPRVIDSDVAGTPGGQIDSDGVEDGVVTLDDSALWLIDNPVLIASGTTLKVGPGAVVQFWGSQPDDAYAVFENSYLQVEGKLDVEGTATAPVTLKPSDLFSSRGVVIDNRGSVTVKYANLFNLAKQSLSVPGTQNKNFELIDHSLITRTVLNSRIAYYRGDNGQYSASYTPNFGVDLITNSRLKRLGYESPNSRETDGIVTPRYGDRLIKGSIGFPDWTSLVNVQQSLIENSALGNANDTVLPNLKSSVLLNSNQRWVNNYGDYITQGTDFEVGYELSSHRAIVADTLQYDGKTYVLAWPGYMDNNTDGVKSLVASSRAFAQSLGGDLVVYSSDAEAQALKDFSSGWNSNVKPNSTLLSSTAAVDVCTEDPGFCTGVQTEGFRYGAVAIGLIPTESGFEWINGEQPTLSDAYNVRDNSFCTSPIPSTWEPIGIVTLSNPGEVGGRCIGYYARVGMVALEIPGAFTTAEVQTEWDSYRDSADTEKVMSESALLNTWWDPVPTHWGTLQAPAPDTHADLFDVKLDASGIFWGTTSETLVDFAITAYTRNFNLLPMSYGPLRETAPESAYPFLASLSILDSGGAQAINNSIGAEATTWTLTFNRDMDESVDPFVTFGPEEPFTDFVVKGAWLDARTWQGQVAISPVATDGYQYVRVSGAVAVDDPWLVTGVDKRRYRFEVITSGVESLNLQASGGEGFVDLSWNQDDYETLLGFNIYRSTAPDSGFIRINQTLVGNGERSYRDTGVEPGVQYYYYFTVALDGSESEPSNTASATPIDTVKPILSHSAISTAPFGSTVLISANVTDNIGVQSVTLYYRAIGGGSYTAVNMANISGSTYRASIPASATQPPGVAYYIAATDGASFAYSGRSTSPNTITVENNPVVTGVTPNTGSSTGGDTITVTGNNFVSGASVLLGNATCQNVTLVDASRLTCVTPASAPELVAVKVINPDGGNGVLTSAFTFVGNSTTLSLPEFQANKGQTRDIALSIDPVSGLQSFSAVISFDNTHLTLGNIVPGPLASGWNFGYSMVDENTVNIQAFSGTRVSGAGKLAILEFLVIADGDAASVLDIESAQLNEGTIQATLVDGSFSIFPGYTLSGSVKYWDVSQKPIEALLTLNDLQEQTSAADTGAYEFAGLLDQQHTIKIEKFDDIDDSIRAYDASLILSHVLGTQTLTGSALVSADVTGDGSVSTQDAAKIAEVAAGLSTVPFPNQASAWRFEPAERQFNSLTADFAAADFTGLFMGDVSGNWSGTGTASVNGLRLEVADMSRLDSGAIIAEVNAYAGSSLTPEAISAIELSLNTSSGVSLLSVEQTVATDTWTRPIIRADGGHLGFTLYGDVSGAFVGEAHVLTLRFSVADTNQQIERLAGHVNEKAVFDSKLMADTFARRPRW